MLSLGVWLALWALLSNNQGWAFGVPLALLAAGVTVQVSLNVRPVQVQILPGLLAFFIVELFIGGWDVARRAWHPRLPIAPKWHRYPMSSTDPRVKLLLSAMVGLLPGTLASHFEGQTLYLHTLDHKQSWHGTVERLEQKLDRLLGGSRS